MLLLFGMLGYFSIPEGQFSLNPFTGEGFNALGIRNNFRVIAQLGIVALGAGMLIISGEFDLSIGSWLALLLVYGDDPQVGFRSCHSLSIFCRWFHNRGLSTLRNPKRFTLTAILITYV